MIQYLLSLPFCRGGKPIKTFSFHFRRGSKSVDIFGEKLDKLTCGILAKRASECKPKADAKIFGPNNNVGYVLYRYSSSLKQIARNRCGAITT